MNIKEYIAQFVENYFKFREERLEGRPSARTKSDVAYITAALTKSLNKVFDSDNYMFLSLPGLGMNQDQLYNLLAGYSPAYLGEIATNYQASKNEFLSSYKMLIQAEAEALKLYGAMALACKDINSTEAVDFSNAVISDLQAWANQILGSYLVFLRNYCDHIVDGLESILNNEKAQEFMTQEAKSIDINEPMGDIMIMLNALEKRVESQLEAGLLEEKINFSLVNEIDLYFGVTRNESQEEATTAN